MRPQSLRLFVLGAFLAAGCSSSTGKGTVEGTVTLDGQPLKSGLIRFVPVDGKSPTADTAITDGQYSAEVPFGEKRVEISAPKVTGKRKMYDTPNSPTVDIVEELLPASYNVQSVLTVTVNERKQTKAFDLTMRPPGKGR
jgi:hypothetical protein